MDYYILIIGQSPDDLRAKVNSAHNDGYEAVGGLFLASSAMGQVFYQAMALAPRILPLKASLGSTDSDLQGARMSDVEVKRRIGVSPDETTLKGEDVEKLFSREYFPAGPNPPRYPHPDEHAVLPEETNVPILNPIMPDLLKAEKIPPLEKKRGRPKKK